MSDPTQRLSDPEAPTLAADPSVVADSLLSEGQMLGGRYRIGRLLGRCGR